MPTPPVDPTFAARPPSTEWEFVPLTPDGRAGLWVWFRPPAIPNGLSASIPTEAFASGAITARTLVGACGVAVETVAAFGAFGGPPVPLVPEHPLWDAPLSEPPAGGDPQCHFWLHAPVAAAPAMAVPQPSGTPASDDDLATLGRMEADWHAITHLERQLSTLRKQLTDMSSKLGSLNRDLSPDEKQLADRQDQNAWQDARRWLRDCSVKVAQCLKAQHIGDSSDAGRRQWFEQVFDQYISPRRTFNGLAAASREFEQHRKLVHTLQLQMSSALARAAQDGEQRARRVLSQIAAKKSRRKPGRR